MKKMLSILVMASALLGLVVGSNAATVTNADGTVFTVTVQGENPGLVPDAYKDQSTYAHQDSRAGLIVRKFDAAVDNVQGGTAGVIRLQAPIPSNALIYDAWVEVITPLLPNTNVTWLQIVNAQDVLQSGTNLSAHAGFKTSPIHASVNVLTGQVVTTTSTNYLELVAANGSAISTGKFIVYMPYLRVQ